MAKTRIKKKSLVVVISGVEKGKQGQVLSVNHEKGQVVVEGVNRRKRAVRRSPENPRGGIIERERPLHVSNVMLAERYEARRAKRGTPAAAAAQDGEGKGNG